MTLNSWLLLFKRYSFVSLLVYASARIFSISPSLTMYSLPSSRIWPSFLVSARSRAPNPRFWAEKEPPRIIPPRCSEPANPPTGTAKGRKLYDGVRSGGDILHFGLHSRGGTHGQKGPLMINLLIGNNHAQNVAEKLI